MPHIDLTMDRTVGCGMDCCCIGYTFHVEKAISFVRALGVVAKNAQLVRHGLRHLPCHGLLRHYDSVPIDNSNFVGACFMCCGTDRAIGVPFFITLARATDQRTMDQYSLIRGVC